MIEFDVLHYIFLEYEEKQDKQEWKGKGNTQSI